MKNKYSIADICEKIWFLEKKYGLLHKEVAGIKVWQSLRVPIYHKLCMETGVFSQLHSSKESLFDVLKRSYYVFNLFFKNPLRGNYTKDTLIFDHARKIKVDDQYVDIYTDNLIRQLDDKEYDVIESVYLGQHLSKRKKNRLYLDNFSVGSFFASLRPVKYSREELEFIELLEKELLEIFNVDIDLAKMFSREIRHLKYGLNYYDRLIKKRKPKRIFIVVSYSFYKKPLIAAAKMNGVETIEIQHGTIGKFHLAYNFPETEPSTLDYFPDRLFLFGKYWADTTEIPLPEDKLEFYGFPYFNEQVKLYSSIEKVDNQVLFISQGAIGKKLSEIAYDFAVLSPGHKVVYKLHPGEYDRWKTEYKELVKARKLPNFQVVDNNEKHLYHYFSQSEYLIGVFSTAIYEGLFFGCKTAIMSLPGYEYMESLIRTKTVKYADNTEDLVAILNKPFEMEYDSEYFFSNVFELKLK